MKPPLGQHFLANPSIAETMIAIAGVSKRDCVLEIGPGKGALTEKLLARAKKVIAVEKDPLLITELGEKFARDIALGRLHIIQSDIRDVNLETSTLNDGAFLCIANIPYYITGDILRFLLSDARQPRIIVILTQKEVAERVAKSKKESVLSLSVKIYGDPHYVKTVRKGSFKPPPQVDSAILEIRDISRVRFKGFAENLFFTLVKKGFSQKRKMLAGNLSTLMSSSLVQESLEHARIAHNARAEDVPLQKWVLLAQFVAQNRDVNPQKGK